MDKCDFIIISMQNENSDSPPDVIVLKKNLCKDYLQRNGTDIFRYFGVNQFVSNGFLLSPYSGQWELDKALYCSVIDGLTDDFFCNLAEEVYKSLTSFRSEFLSALWKSLQCSRHGTPFVATRGVQRALFAVGDCIDGFDGQDIIWRRPPPQGLRLEMLYEEFDKRYPPMNP